MASQDTSAKANIDYINQLIKEQEGLNDKFSYAHKLLQQEIDRIRSDPSDDTQRKDGHIVIHGGRQFRLRVKVHIPIDEHPSFNFVGKLLGPKGSSLQQLQEATQTRMAILGRGSMRDRKKEEEFRSQGDPKYSHLNEDLHVEVTAYAPAPEAYRRMSSAVAELQQFLVPDGFDGSRPPQFMADGKLKQFAADGGPHMAPPRGGPPRPMGPPLMGGREPPPPRRPMVQSTYVAPEVDDWPQPRPPAPRRGGFHGGGAAQPPQARANRGYEDATNDYNNYGDNYGDYNSGNAGSFYDYNAEVDAGYADGFAEDGRAGPMRGGVPAGRGAVRNNSRVQAHPYAGATRRGY